MYVLILTFVTITFCVGEAIYNLARGGYGGLKASLTRLILVYFTMSHNLETLFSVLSCWFKACTFFDFLQHIKLLNHLFVKVKSKYCIGERTGDKIGSLEIVTYLSHSSPLKKI